MQGVLTRGVNLDLAPNSVVAPYSLDCSWVMWSRKYDAVHKWNQTKSAPMVWFYVGHRAEVEGRREAAIDAYRRSIELAAVAGGHPTGNWAAYRLEALTQKESGRPR